MNKLIIILSLVIVKCSGMSDKVCDALKMVQSQECKDSKSTFCQYVNEAVSKYCTQNTENLFVENIDYPCYYRHLYAPCPERIPVCKNGQCFPKEENEMN